MVRVRVRVRVRVGVKVSVGVTNLKARSLSGSRLSPAPCPYSPPQPERPSTWGLAQADITVGPGTFPAGMRCRLCDVSLV